MNPLLLTDAYKISHKDQYPEGTERVYSNVTARSSRVEGSDEIVVFGIQYFVEKYLKQQFDEHFFRRSRLEVESEMRDFFDGFFGPGAVDLQPYMDLHNLGELPIRIECLPEGTVCPVGVPFMTIENTDPRFFWLTNFIETLCQNTIWNPITSATTARRYWKLLSGYSKETCDDDMHLPYQAHNFSMRGMSSLESAVTTDLAHLLYFDGSDTLPGSLAAQQYYGASGVPGCSVPATEHAVMCAGGKGDEVETFRRLVSEVYPSGIVSIVSDTWDLWNVLDKTAPQLSDVILSRDGKVVFRPDSGDPERIICGHRVSDKEPISREQWEIFYEEGCTAFRRDDQVVDVATKKNLSDLAIEGAIRILDRHFGSTENEMGYKVLNPKVGLIYGDAITIDRAARICESLKQMGYASSNIVFGVGSFTYQYVTRDTYSIACKATWAQVNGEGRDIFKDPVTDDGTKKSACGRLSVSQNESGKLVLRDQVRVGEATLLREYRPEEFESIRERCRSES